MYTDKYGNNFSIPNGSPRGTINYSKYKQLQYTNHEHKTIFNVKILKSQLDAFNLTLEQVESYDQLINFFTEFNPNNVKSEEEHKKASLNLLLLYKLESLNNADNKVVQVI